MVDDDPDDDSIDVGDDPIDLEPDEEFAAPPRGARMPGRPAKIADPRLRQLPGPEPERGPSWWVGKDRDDLARTAEARRQDPKLSKAASSVKTPMNFVE